MSDHGWTVQMHPSDSGNVLLVVCFYFLFPFDVLHLYDGSEAFIRITGPASDVRPCVQLLIYS